MLTHSDTKSVIAAMKRKNYNVFTGSKGHDLNIVGIRTDDNRSNTFNDWLLCFYNFDNKWNTFAFPITTDPGLFYRENPINVTGTAIMKPGQYRRAYKIGLHKGYKALQQKGPITVFRDSNKDNCLDLTVGEDTGLHAVNIHRSNPNRSSVQVDKWSAGCQVFQDPDHYNFFMAMCDRAAEKYGNSFTYTLLEEKDLE